MRGLRRIAQGLKPCSFIFALNAGLKARSSAPLTPYAGLKARSSTTLTRDAALKRRSSTVAHESGSSIDMLIEGTALPRRCVHPVHAQTFGLAANVRFVRSGLGIDFLGCVSVCTGHLEDAVCGHVEDRPFRAAFVAAQSLGFSPCDGFPILRSNFPQRDECHNRIFCFDTTIGAWMNRNGHFSSPRLRGNGCRFFAWRLGPGF